MTQESMEVKVAKLETKMDAILKSMDAIHAKLDRSEANNVNRAEFNAFKTETNRRQLQKTVLTSILTFVITTLIGYVVVSILGK